MVNNSTTINKMDNHFSLNTKRPRHMALEIHILAWDRHTLLKCDRQISIATRIIFFFKVYRLHCTYARPDTRNTQ